LQEECEDFLNPDYAINDKVSGSKHTANIDRKNAVEVITGGRKIIVHGELWLNKEFTNGIFAPENHRERKRLKFYLVIQINIFCTI
jgi:hypothetical protein